MKLKELLSNINYEIIQRPEKIEIKNISWDSRNTKSDSLFICTQGRNVDRHYYAKDAVRNGAIAIVIEHEIGHIPEDITIIKVENSRIAMASIANRFYGEPSKSFNLIGITGTNGKTSVSYFISKILESLGRKVGVIGTIGNSIGDALLKTIKLNPTTPDSIELQASFSEMINEKVPVAVMEVSSSALKNYRVHNCDFDIGIFTNLTQDHLEEHGTMENYKKEKMKLFTMCKIGIINGDDEVSNDIKKNASCQIITYGINKTADFMAKDIKYSCKGITFTLVFCGTEQMVELSVLGEFNVYNMLAAIAACYFSGLPLSVIINALNNVIGVRGRFQMIPNSRGYLIIVDYAHSPDGIKNILKSVRKLTDKKLIIVFGCGGNRDKTKRAIMGETAGRLADLCIITSDNPRNENPIHIIEDIEKGIIKTNCSYKKIDDRKDAILTALKIAEPGDAVIISGKGHENYQIIKDKTIHFDDGEIAQDFLIYR